jgi:hypothetical protein
MQTAATKPSTNTIAAWPRSANIRRHTGAEEAESKPFHRPGKEGKLSAGKKVRDGLNPLLFPSSALANSMTVNRCDANDGTCHCTNFNDDESFEAGLGMYNLNQVSTEQKNLQLRYGRTYMAHIGYSRYLSSSNQIFVGGLYSYLNSGNSLSLIAGYSLSPEFTNTVGIDFGLVYQANNCFSPYLKLNANTFKFIFSYDIPMEPNISYLQNSRSMEIGIQCSLSKVSDNITMARKHVSCFR